MGKRKAETPKFVSEICSGSMFFHLCGVAQIFQRESIFCSRISSGGSLFIKKLVPGGTNFRGSIFTMTNPFIVALPCWCRHGILGFHVRQFFSPVTSHKPFFTLPT